MRSNVIINSAYANSNQSNSDTYYRVVAVFYRCRQTPPCGTDSRPTGKEPCQYRIYTINYVNRLIVLLADRTNVRAYATVLRLSVCRLSVTLCIVDKRCVLEQKLLLRAYRKSYMRNRLVPK